MNRRAFLTLGGEALTAALTVPPAGLICRPAPEPSVLLPEDLEERIAAVIRVYDSQGNHRTGTTVDAASAEWLANEVRRAGAAPSLEPFTLYRVDPDVACLRVGDRRIDGVPVFDAGFTSHRGVSGRLGPLGSGAEIGVGETTPFRLMEQIGVEERDQVAEARHSRHAAIVLLTRGTKPGLFLINAAEFRRSSGPPMLQVSSTEREWLRQQAEGRSKAIIIAHVSKTPAQAFNVTAQVGGTKAGLAPIVVMAPRSGWWQCASEQGSRLACWLEILRTVAAARPPRTCLFVALSGHELGYLGIDAYLAERAPLIARARVWLFLGSSIGEPRQPNLVHASDEVLEQWIVRALERERLPVNARASHTSRARGEAGAIQRGGGSFVTLACGTDVYHNVGDRWPEAIDVGHLARYARALAHGVLQLAQQE
jgi:hypothetical protein